MYLYFIFILFCICYLFAVNIVIFFFLCSFVCFCRFSLFFLLYLFVFQYVLFYQMNIKQNETHSTPPNEPRTQQTLGGGRGVQPTAIIWCKHPFQKKNKKFKCNYIQNYTLSKLNVRPFSTWVILIFLITESSCNLSLWKISSVKIYKEKSRKIKRFVKSGYKIVAVRLFL